MQESKTIPLSYAVITPGVSPTANSGTGDTATFNLTVAEGDWVFMVVNLGTSIVDPVVVNGPGASSWTYVGNIAAGYSPQLWVLGPAHAASGSVTVQRVGGTFVLCVAQVYSNVATMAQSFLPTGTAPNTVNPAVGPAATLYFNVTIPGSMGVTGFSWAAGTNGNLQVTDARNQLLGTAQAVAIKDALFSVTGQQQLFLPWSVTTGTPTHTRLSVLFTPKQVTPPPTGDIPAITQAIIQWRKQAQLDKIYLMPPAQRAARLAELKALAQQLKQAQIAQMQ